MSIDHITAHAPLDRIDRPALKRAARRVGPIHIPREHLVVGDHVEDHAAIARVVGIRHVKDIARIDLAPHHLAAGAFAGK